MRNDNPKPAVFMDRDGVLTVEKKRITLPGDIELYENAANAVTRLHEIGYIVIVVSNQSGIARGLYSEEDVNSLHMKIKEMTGVDEIYYCPHHPDGIIDKYAVDCDCRKPGLGMFHSALKNFQIDIGRSYMVGDRSADIEFGKKAGLTTILVRTGYGGKDMDSKLVADHIVDDIHGVCDLLDNM